MQNETTGDAISYLWAAEGAANPISEAENPIFVFNQAGTYSIALAATNATGSTTETKIDYITVGDVPTADFTFTQVNNGLSITDLSIDADSLTWNFGDGTIVENQADPYHVYEENGEYTVTLIAKNACGIDSLSATINVATVGPIADFTADATDGCAPFTVNFENLSENSPTSFLWIFEGANIENSLNVNPTVSYAEAGEFTVTLVVYNAFGIDSTAYTNYITVNPQPIAAFETETNGQWANFTNNSQFADSYLWEFGDGTTSTEENPSHLYEEAENYEVYLAAINSCDTVYHKISLEIESILPTAVFESDIQEGCADLIVQFMDGSLANPTDWFWSFPGGNPATSTEQNPVVTYENAGDYTVMLNVTNEAGTGNLAYVNYISVNDVPNAEFTFEQSTTIVDFMIDEMADTDYTWDFGDGNASTFPSTTHEYEEPGTYLVTLTAENICGTSTFTTEVTTTTTSTEMPDFIDIFEVYPNPNDGQFTIRLEGERYTDGDLTIRFTNVVGQVIDTQTVPFNGSLQQSYGFRDLPAGLYLVQIEAGNNRLFKKIVVE